MNLRFLDGSVFPARAGMILGEDAFDPVANSIPRESGDDPNENTTKERMIMYSPRERG